MLHTRFNDLVLLVGLATAWIEPLNEILRLIAVLITIVLGLVKLHAHFFRGNKGDTLLVLALLCFTSCMGPNHITNTTFQVRDGYNFQEKKYVDHKGLIIVRPNVVLMDSLSFYIDSAITTGHVHQWKGGNLRLEYYERKRWIKVAREGDKIEKLLTLNVTDRD